MATIPNQSMSVYKITNLVNGKLYIGITKNIKDRFTYHKRRFNKISKQEYIKKPLYAAFRKYGIDNFKFEIIEINLTKKEAEKREISLIKELKTLSHENGYNISKGGDLGPGIYGEAVNTAKLTLEEVKDIYARIEKGETIKSIYEDYKDKISRSGFKGVYTKNWTQLPRPKKQLPNGASINKETVLKIKELLATGMNAKQISEQLNIKYHTCWNISKGRTYSRV